MLLSDDNLMQLEKQSKQSKIRCVEKVDEFKCHMPTAEPKYDALLPTTNGATPPTRDWTPVAVHPVGPC